jgi:hypothetical protein
MTELLRQALAECGSLRAVETATGVLRQSLMAFRDGKTLRLDNADVLARHFGVESRMTRRKTSKGVRKGKA